MKDLCKPRLTAEERRAARDKARQARRAEREKRRLKDRSEKGAKGQKGDEGMSRPGDDGIKKGKPTDKKGCGSRGGKGKTGKQPKKKR